MSNKYLPILIVVILIVFGMFMQSKYEFFSILPSGQYNRNTNCTFITNVDYGSNGEDIGDYSSSGAWISVDLNGDGQKEGYGKGATTTSSANVCNKQVLTYTPIGFKVVIWDWANSEIGVCSSDGKKVYRYKDSDSDGNSAILECASSCTPSCTSKQCGSDGCSGSCGTCSTGQTCNAGQCISSTCTPNWITGSWSACSGGTQTRTVTDSNNCGTTTGKPATSQSCTTTCKTDADANCNGVVSDSEILTQISNWLSGSITRTKLGEYAMAWMES